jgi:virginiamycin A acetyltransferase
LFRIFRLLLPEVGLLKQIAEERNNYLKQTMLEQPVKLYGLCRIIDSDVGKFTYIADGAIISLTSIGRFCSIGPNLLCGYGIHPLNGISTSPMFFSVKKQNGYSLCDVDKIEERKKINIGHDVFIGANVTILDGVSIGNGAVIGAGCLVNKDVPPYAVVGGVPMRIIKYRFEEDNINVLQEMKWWNWSLKELKRVEQNFFDIEAFKNAKK